MLDISSLIRKIILDVGAERSLNGIELPSFPTIEHDIPGRFAVGISSDGNTCWIVSGITGKPDEDTHFVLVEVFQYININYGATNVDIVEDKPANTSYSDCLIKNSNLLINTVPWRFAPGILPNDSSQYTLVQSGSFSNLISTSESDYRTFRSMTNANTSTRLPLIRAYAMRVPGTTSGSSYTAAKVGTMLYSYSLWTY